MATITLAAMRALVRELAEQETVAPTTALVDDTELDERINEAASLFRDMQIDLGWTEWIDFSTQTITTVANTTDYSLADGVTPAGKPPFYELLGVRALQSPDQYPLPQWNWHDRAQLLSTYHSPQPSQYRYRIVGTKIIILPTPKAVHSIFVDYIGDMTKLTASVDLTCPYGWHKWPAYLAAADIVNKERLPIDGLMARWSIEDQRIRAQVKRRDASHPPRVIMRRAGGRDIAAMARRLGYPSLWKGE